MSDGYTLITGASEGIGRTFATRLAEQGRNLILVARNQDRLNELAQSLTREHGVRVEVVAQDLAQPNAAQRVFAACASFDVRHLINNAGCEVPVGRFETSEVGAVNAMIQLNIVALTELTHHFLPGIVAAHGSIVNVASHAAFQPVPYMSAYAASKSYVLHFTEALNAELNDKYRGQVQVMALCPGATDTEFWKRSDTKVESTRFRVMQPKQVVQAAFDGLARRSNVVIPGVLLKLSTQLLRLSPRTLNTFIAKKLVGY